MRIVDLTDPSAAYAVRLLVECGHDVVRLDHPAGDSLRRQGVLLDGQLDVEHGAAHQFMNAGKRSLTLDVAAPPAREVLEALLRWADVVVASAPLPVDPSFVHATNPAVVLTLVVDGDEPELCLAARSGLLALTGHPGQPPALLGGGGVLHSAASLFVAIATAAALVERSRSGRGQTVTVSILDALESLAEQAMVAYVTDGGVAERVGYRGSVTGVSGAFETTDGYWMLSVPPPRDVWLDFVNWVGDAELAADPTLEDEAERAAKADFIRDRLAQWSKERSRDELVEGGQANRMPATPVVDAVDLVDDPQLHERGFLRLVDHPLFGPTVLPMGALGGLRGTDIGPAPRLGEHTAEILADLGFSRREQAVLFEQGVV